MTNILAIDTSTDTCSVSLGKNGEIFNFHQNLPRQHTENLLKVIKDLLDEADLNYEDLNTVAVGIGPGSYTGIRLSCSVAQGISFSQNIKGVVLSSLELLSLELNTKNSFKEVVGISEPNLGNIYIAHTSFIDGNFESSFEFIPKEEFRLESYPEECVFVGEGCELFAEIENQLPGASPKASYMHKYINCFANDTHLIKPEEILPIYLNDENSWRKIK